jgi:hypothetical protein
MMNVLLVVRAVGALALPVIGMGGAAQRRRAGGSGSADTKSGEAAPVDLPIEELDDDELGIRRSRVSVTGPRPGRRELRALRQQPAGLRKHDLRRADLRGWALAGVDLSEVDLSHARLRRADLQGASLARARLDYADLSGADLRGADLDGVTFLETDLGGADLRGVDLRHAGQLPMANVRGCKTDQTTRWPPGFDPRLAMSPRM